MPRMVQRQELDPVVRAVRRRRMTQSDIMLLRQGIAALQEIETENAFVRGVARNLKVAATQLGAIEERTIAGSFDEAAFARMPPHLRTRIVVRLDNLARRMAPQPGGPAAAGDPAFGCVAGYERCRARHGAVAFWCQLAMIVCLVRCLLAGTTAGARGRQR